VQFGPEILVLAESAVTLLAMAWLASVAAAEPVVIDSFHAPQPFVAYRIAALWLLFGSSMLTVLAFLAAFILSAFPRTNGMSRWAMTVAKVSGLLAVAALLVGLAFTILMISGHP